MFVDKLPNLFCKNDRAPVNSGSDPSAVLFDLPIRHGNLTVSHTQAIVSQGPPRWSGNHPLLLLTT
jgi:hypothetical protein